MSDETETARLALACLDLTNLNDDCAPGDIRDLVARAATPHGPVAAICIWPRFVAQARELIGTGPVKIATVVNFPSGEEPVADMITMTETAVAEGADEIDMVIPYRPFLEGEEEDVHSRVARVKAAAGPARVKAILETGILEDPERIRRAAEIAIEGGADFIKTSTGKVAVNATLEAARMMLEVIRDHGPGVGLKPAGGVKTTVQAAAYLDLADEIMGEGWASPATFRFGASGLLDALLATIEGREAAAAEGY